jgi:hypothetical protein
MFDPARPIEPTDTPTQQLLALTGRDPGARPVPRP